MSKKDTTLSNGVIIFLTEEEARQLMVILHVAGFSEKKDLPESFRKNRTALYKNMSRIQKRLRKGIEAL